MRRGARAGLVLTAALAVVLAGCGRDSGSGGGGEAGGEQVADGKASGEITVWAMGAEGEKLSVLADAFMAENPDAKVTVTPIPWDGANNKISTAIAGGQTPDVSMLGSTWMGQFAATGALDAVPENLVAQNDFFDGAWQTAVVDDTAFGVPWYVETRMFYVNTDVATRAGVTEAPATWDELKTAVKAMKEQGGAEWGVYLQPGQTGSWQSAMPFVWQNGGDIADGDTFTLDTAETTGGLEYFTSFHTEGLSPKEAYEGGEFEPLFADGRLGSFISGPWHISLLNELGAEGRYTVWPMPKGDAGATSFIGGSNLGVFKDSENRDGAWKFVEYLSRPEVQVQWYQEVSSLPAVQSAWDDPAMTEDPLLAAFGDQLQDTKAPPAIATWEQIAAAIDGEIEKAARGTTSAADAAKSMQSKASSIGTGG